MELVEFFVLMFAIVALWAIIMDWNNVLAMCLKISHRIYNIGHSFSLKPHNKHSKNN